MAVARTERLLNLLTLLLNARRPVPPREIWAMPEFAAYRTGGRASAERTFERDKAALLELGVPLKWIPPEELDNEEGGGGYVIQRERYYLPDLHLTPAQVALLSLAGAAAATVEGSPIQAAVVRALNKLGFDVEDVEALPAFAHAPLLGGSPPGRTAEHLQLLHQAVALRRRVVVRYHGSQRDEATVRKVEPYGLFYRRGVWYLVAYCCLRQAERTFHLGRMLEVTYADPRRCAPQYEVPDSFDVSSYVQQRPWEFPRDAPCEVTIRLAERLVPAIAELFGPRARLERTSQGPIVSLQVTHFDALVAAVLPYGAAAEVLAPAWLREKLRHIYGELTKRYQRRVDAPRQIAAQETS